MNTQKPPSIDHLQQRLADVSAQVRHENDLLNHRLSWMWTLQGLLFAAYGILADRNVDTFTATIVCLVGVVSCISVGYSLMVGTRALNVLNPLANNLRKEIDVLLGLQSIKDDQQSFWAFLLPKFLRDFLFPWIILPRFMTGVWIALLVHTLMG